MIFRATLLSVLAIGAASAQEAPDKVARAVAPVVEAVKAAQAAEAALPPPASVREKLERLGRLDQAGRMQIHRVDFASLTPEEGLAARRALAAAIEPVDAANLAELRKILPVTGWFSRAEYGVLASEAAFHIVQHSGDLELMKSVVPRLQPLAERGEIDGSDFASMYDRVQTMRKLPQRYGTQFRCIAGKIEPFPLEDAARVEEWRAPMKLHESYAASAQRHSGRRCG